MSLILIDCLDLNVYRSPHPFGDEKSTGWFVHMDRNINDTSKNEGSLGDFLSTWLL